MKLKNRIFIISTFKLLIICLTVIICEALDGRIVSNDGNLVVTYKVEDGYKITIRIDTKIKKKAYLKSFCSDVLNIKIEFIDVNGDSLNDVIIKYADEMGYTPAVLVNNANLYFIDALSDFDLYINTEIDIEKNGHAKRRGDYKIKTHNGIPELTFYDVLIGNKGYRYVTFRYDKTNYEVHSFQKRGNV